MKQLSKRQRDAFSKMTKSELTAVIIDSSRQMDVICYSTTEAAAERREELQARIDFCRERKLKARETKPARKCAIIATPRKTDKGWLVVFDCGHWAYKKTKPRNNSAGLCLQCP